MATVFPLNPQVNDEYNGYRWNGTYWGIIGVDLNADYATIDYTDNAVASIVDSAPSTLNTLNELAAALNDDASFATTVTNALAQKPSTGKTIAMAIVFGG